ncbi:MAG: hypothetical protein RR470_07665 [Vagococcus sp.]|uniref:hypothetical protein n=1 Tax=Vagococcus sp. TaxID=1933889 RepID=UPI002FC7D6F4
MALNLAQQKTKKLAEAVMKNRGIDYDEWLTNHHVKAVEEGNDIILKALSQTNSKNAEKKDSVTHSNSETNKGGHQHGNN